MTHHYNTDAEYFADTGTDEKPVVNASRLKACLQSLAHFRYYTPPKPSFAMERGSALDSLVTEGEERFRDRLVLIEGTEARSLYKTALAVKSGEYPENAVGEAAKNGGWAWVEESAIIVEGSQSTGLYKAALSISQGEDIDIAMQSVFSANTWEKHKKNHFELLENIAVDQPVLASNDIGIMKYEANILAQIKPESIILPSTELEHIYAAAEVLRQEVPYLFQDGVKMQDAIKTTDYTGLEVKAKPDFWHTPNGATITDLKFTHDASPSGFVKSCKDFAWDVQAAFYERVFRQAYADLVDLLGFEDFKFVLIEPRPPYTVYVTRLPDEHRAKVGAWIQQQLQHIAKGNHMLASLTQPYAHITETSIPKYISDRYE